VSFRSEKRTTKACLNCPRLCQNWGGVCIGGGSSSLAHGTLAPML
jgi:hypothetical protein